MAHIYLCREAPRAFALFELNGDSFLPLGNGSIISLLSSAVDRIEKSPATTSFTFSCRPIEDIANGADPVDAIDVGAALSALRATKSVPPIVTLMVMTGEEHRDDMTTLISWSAGKFYGSGSAGLTHVSRVGRRLLQFFEHPRAEQNTVGVTPGKRLRQIEAGAAGCGEEVLWRPGWTANDLIPGSFEPKPTSTPPTLTPEARAIREARMKVVKARCYRDRALENSGHVWNKQTRSWSRKPGVRPLGNGIYRPK